MLQFIDKTSTLIDLVPNLTKEENIEIRRHLTVQDPTTLKESLKVYWIKSVIIEFYL